MVGENGKTSKGDCGDCGSGFVKHKQLTVTSLKIWCVVKIGDSVRVVIIVMGKWGLAEDKCDDEMQ